MTLVIHVWRVNGQTEYEDKPQSLDEGYALAAQISRQKDVIGVSLNDRVEGEKWERPVARYVDGESVSGGRLIAAYEDAVHRHQALLKSKGKGRRKTA